MTALADTNSTGTNSTDTTTPTSTITNPTQTPSNQQPMIIGDMQGFGMGRGHMEGFMGGMNSNIEISDEYTATINSILNNDSDVANLISQGYNVTAIQPILKSVIGADGTLTTQASSATVLLQNGTSGISIVNVDVANAKVTYIETITRTVIDKSGSS